MNVLEVKNMNTDTLIVVKSVSKKFCKDFKQSLWYGLTDLFFEFFGKKRKHELRKKEFWAVKDISFELKRGQCLGLIGHNGAGKSTLLKMLNGLIKPDEGSIEMNGKVGALIELGAGFNPILTGRENIFINGAILGFSKKEIDEKLKDIIDFSEISEFIDMPVQSYSSGMKVRLGFAVAAQLEPDILIIDEVLAVGDLNFRKKCIEKIDTLKKNTATIFVSHNLNQVERISDNILILDKGKNLYFGEINLGINKFYQINNNYNITSITFNSIDKIETIKEINIENTQDNNNLNLCVHISATENIKDVIIGIQIFNNNQTLIYAIRNIDNPNSPTININKGKIELNINLKNINLVGNKYNLNIACKSKNNAKIFEAKGYTLELLKENSKYYNMSSLVQFENEWTVYES